MPTPADLPWSTLLLTCMSVSLVATLAAAAIAAVALDVPRTDRKLDRRSLITKDDQKELATAITTSTTTTTAAATTPTTTSANRVVHALQSMCAEDVPDALRVASYFSEEYLEAFQHRAIFDGCSNVVAVIDAIHPYLVAYFHAQRWKRDAMGVPSSSLSPTVINASASSDATRLDNDSRRERSSWRVRACVDPSKTAELVIYPDVDAETFAPDKIINLETTPSSSTRKSKQVIISSGVCLLGGTFDVSEGSIFLGKGVRVEPNVYIKGPCFIGDHSTLRSGAYLRGDVLVGSHVVLRGELKNALIMDHAELCHPGYCGDSVCGYKSHFGNQVTTANMNLFANTSRSEILIDVVIKSECHSSVVTRYNTGRTKMGVVLGDFSQLGCSSVTDPGTLIQRDTVVYPLTRLRKGIYGPSTIIKNKPQEHGVLEIVSIQPTAAL